MDSPEINTGRKRLFRFCFTLVFALIVSFVFSFLFGFVAVVIGNFFDSRPATVDAQCRILSSSVDLRSTKVCELGFLNYNAKHVFYPTERRKFRCRHDYYWASVFKVEYVEISGERRYAVAEAPKEALPVDCRPSFGIAWLIKDKFKVNETYNCRYVLSMSNVDIFSDNLFNCRAEDPSALEMIRRTSIFFTSVMDSWSSKSESAQNLLMGATLGLICGVLIPLLFIIFIRLLQKKETGCSVRRADWLESEIEAGAIAGNGRVELGLLFVPDRDQWVRVSW
ncbi:hypothetical protein H6P81_005777 [Aristolochia fimbriata]|uniref:Uncharacterized protein n=1 Tax=Aristolochia fimbriata TaxID=158543 RepID=A0AAV7EVK9_ARIFI|nr:hypothetical protein H6P81_005777 [Aristolochia fimbriata]